MRRPGAVVATADDTELGAALERYARGVTSPRVSVTYRDGVARISGVVTSETIRTALEDMLSAHDGVREVVNALVVEAGAQGALSRRRV